MILYSIQELKVWELLQKEKVLYCDPTLGDNWLFGWEDDPEAGYKEQYEWLYQQYASRIGNTKVEPVWWAYVNKPDLRYERFQWPDKEVGVRIKLDVPDELVLVSCLDLWVCGVLNGGYIAKTREEDEAFDLKYFGYSHKDGWNRNFNHAPLKEERTKLIEESWDRIFNYNEVYNEENDDWYGREPFLQANFSPLKLEWVKKVTKFIGIDTKKDKQEAK